MQQPIARHDVYEPSLDVTIGGRSVEVASVDMERALPDPMQGDALRGASGTIIALEGPDLADTIVTPWDPDTQWPPVPQTSAEVALDTGAGPVQILGGGLVTSSSAGSGSRKVRVDVADAYESLNRTISWDNVADAMPALTEATAQRYVSLRASAVTDMILRHCGWYCTPPRLPYAALSVPAMGTMWPEAGTCVTCAQEDGTGYPPMFTEPWGVGVGDVAATYNRAAAYSIKGRGYLEMTAIAGRLNGGTKHLMARTDSYRWVRLSWTDTTASLWVTNTSGAAVSVASLPRSLGSFLYATLEYVTDTSVRVTLQVDGQTTAATTVSVHADVTTTHMTTFEISGDGVGAGFQAAFPTVPRSLALWEPNAVIYDRASGHNALQVLKAQAGADCAKLLQQQCEAQAATYWIDETGVLRWWDLGRLEARSPVADLTSDDDIRSDDSMEWMFDRSSLRSRVVVNWREPLIEGGWRTSVDLWQGGGSTLEMTGANNPVEDWINVPSDEVWIMPDLTLSRIGDSGVMTDFNYGWMSHYGAIVRRSDGAEEWAQLSGSFLVSVERVTDNAFKFSTTWTGAGQAVQRTPEGAESAGMWGIRRNFDLPIIRGKKKYILGDQSTTSIQTGPVHAPEYEVDADWWIQNETQARYTADYYGTRVTVPQPVLGNIGLVPVPGLQLGDMVDVIDDAITRLTIRGVVVADDRTIGERMTHSIAVRPISVSHNGVTWHQWASVTRPSTWTGWGTDQGGTWTEWGSDPLGKEK